MPYVVRKRKGKKCVYKKKKNGKPGEKVGCTKKSIKKYLAALHINANESLEEKTMKISKQKLERIIREEVAREMGMREEEVKSPELQKLTELEISPDIKKLAVDIVNTTDLDGVLYGKGSKAVGLLGRGSKDAPEAFSDLMICIAILVDSAEEFVKIRDEVDDALSYAEPT